MVPKSDHLANTRFDKKPSAQVIDDIKNLKHDVYRTTEVATNL